MSKVVVVTGASRGIGKGIALASSKEGWITYITGRNLESLQSTCDDIKRQSGKDNIFPIVCDHKNDTEVQNAFDKIYKAHGKVDVLVNNAYGAVDRIMDSELPSVFWEKPFDIWDASHVVGLRSHYIATVIVAKHMVKNKQGLIVNISSGGGVSYLFDVAYGVGKAALDRLTADTAHQLLPSKVTVVSLYPGAVATERIQSQIVNNPRALPKVKAMFVDLESCEFAGRAVVALAKDPNVIQFTGKVLQTVELAKYYKFTDVNNKIAGEELAKFLREQLKKPPKQWEMPAVFSKL